MTTSIVRKSTFGSNQAFERLDAEYSEASSLALEQALRKIAGEELRALAVPYSGPTLNGTFAEEDAPVEYIAIDSVDNQDGLTYSEELRYGDRPSRAKYVLKKSDLLVSNVRPNRNAVSLTSARGEGSLASSGFTLVRLRDGSAFSAPLLFAYLKTEFAITQLMRRDRGSMYPAVLSADVMDTWIPLPPKGLAGSIETSIESASASHEKFFSLLGQAEAILAPFLEPLGSPPSPLETRKSSADTTVVRSSDFFGADGAGRIDAEFFRSEYEDFDQNARELADSFFLGEHYQLAPGRGLGNGEEDTPLVKQAVLTNAGVNWSALAFEEGVGRGSQSDVQPGDVILACTAHEIFYVGRKVDFVRDLPEQAVGNAAVADILRIRPIESDSPPVPGSYLAAFLRSAAGRHQVQRCIRGLRGGHVYKDDLSRYVRVPVPDKKLLRKFEESSSKAEEERLLAKESTEAAVAKLSAWIRSAL
ncbi:MAG: hypothetical protein AAF726_11520 [Planctomycetota bacterium]